MSQDFFLLNRAHQVARLAKGSGFSLPQPKLRTKLPATLVEFYALIDRMCAITDKESPTYAETSLSDGQRRDLVSFEKVVVDNRFSSDPQVKQPAVELIRAIFADAAYFSGLKPLPQYTDVFAYELLFPSWLNLLTALMLPRSDNGKPRMTGAQQGELFSFLSKLSGLSVGQEYQLTGFMTLIARRFDAPDCECLLQRLADLVTMAGSATIQTIDKLDAEARDAKEFTKWLAAYLTVRHSSHRWPATSAARIAQHRPPIRVLPTELQTRLDALESQADWPAYFALAQPLSELIKSEQVLATEFAILLEKHTHRAADMLEVLLANENKVQSEEAQICLANLIELRLKEDPAASLTREVQFSKSMAARLQGHSESTLACFCRQFITDEKNRQFILGACESDEKQQQLVKFLLERAAKTSDDSLFLNLLSCITIISPDEEQRSARHALQAIDAVISNRSIGTRELGDLVGDMQQNPTAALRSLANPIMGGAGKSDRLASLYLTLNEITEVFQSSGRVGNFSVVRAKYSAMASGGD